MIRRSLPVLALAAVALSAQAQTYNLTVDANKNKLSISPLIYGVAFATQAQLEDLNATCDRMGGNNQTRYNWRQNAANLDADWYFESMADANPTPAYRVDSFVQANKAAGAETLFTVPMIQWIAKVTADRSTLSSFSVKKYGPQTSTDPWLPDAGDGISTEAGNPFISGNDPNDANVANSVSFESGLLSHLVNQWGTNAKGGIRYYEMDNESSIWFSTHRDVHPVGPKMDEILSDIESYGSMVKAADPTAMVLAPEEWGWLGYLYSGYDQQYSAAHNYNGVYPDRAAHGNMDYVPWLLSQLKAYETAHGQRLLDVLSLHAYPMDGSYANGVSPSQQLLRNKSTRSLWDPNYVDQSWVDSVIQLIPRMQGWVNTYYPGTKIAITEYNWGAEPYMNGATTQADLEGIFGKYGLYMATRWTVPQQGSPTYNAMKMYRNYDGQKSTFGDVSVSDTGSNPDDLASYAATRTADGSLTIMLINKVNTSGMVNVALNNFAGNGVAQVWQLNSVNGITRQPDLGYRGTSLSIGVPRASITLLVLQPSGTKEAVPPPPTGLAGYPLNEKALLTWNANPQSAQYVVYESSQATTGFKAIAVTSNSSFTVGSLTNGTKYYFEVLGKNASGVSPLSSSVEVTPVQPTQDNAQYSFESGTQGWTDSGGMITGVGQSLNEAYLGSFSLQVSINAGGSDSQTASVSSPGVKPGQTVTFHVYLPANCGLSSLQPYVLQNASGNWTWTGDWQPITSLKLGAWNTFTVTVPSNASGLDSLGVQFNSSAAWAGNCYIDSVSWK
jgi:hypothetical protein